MNDDASHVKRGAPDRIAHALFVHGGALGDFILSLRIVESLRLVGAARIILLGKPHFARLARSSSGIDQVIDLDSGGVHTLFAEHENIPDDLARRLGQCELAVEMLGGYLPARLRDAGTGRVISIEPNPRPDWQGHISEQWLADLAGHGLYAEPGPPRIDIEADRHELDRILGEAGGVLRGNAFSVLHPGSGGMEKCWPVGEFAAIGRHLRNIGLPPIALLGPVEAERLSTSARDTLRKSMPVIEGLNLSDAAILIASARLYVGNDSGISHLAAAVGAPSVVIFGPTDPRRWRPLGSQVWIVSPAARRLWPDRDAVITTIEAGLRITPQASKQ